MNLRRLLGFTAVIALTIGTAALAQPQGGGQGGGQGGPGGQGGQRRMQDPGAMIDRLHEIVNTLNLTDDQKPKVEEIFTRAKENLKQTMEQNKDADPQERAQKMRELTQGLREELTAVLDQDQAAAFQQKMQEMRQRGGQQQGQGQGRGQLIQRLKDAADKLELTDDQKAKFADVIKDAEAQMQEIRSSAQGNPEEARTKSRALGEETTTKIREILTPEQQTKFQELMQQQGQQGQGNGAAPGAPRRNRNGNGNGDPNNPTPPATQPADAPKADPAPSDKPKDSMDPMEPKTGDSRAGEKRAAAPESPGPRLEVGTLAPDFKLAKLDGNAIQLSSFKGKLVVLLFGSYTSPSFRQRAAAIEELRHKFNSQVNFLVIYTKEAHPKGGWEVERNADAQIEIKQHKDEESRKSAARDAKQKLNFSVPIVIDSMDDATAKAYNAWPNNAAYLIGRDGEIRCAQQWFDPFSMEDAIQAAMKK